MQCTILSKVFLSFIFAFVFFAADSTVRAQGEIGISGEVGNGRLQKGKTATVSVILNIPGGLHVNANNPGNRLAIPTRVNVSAAGLKVGAINYPRGKSKKFSFSEEQIIIYEGQTVIRFPVTVPPNFKGNVARMRVVVNYQSCTDEVCYRPRSGEITLSAAVR
jgi:hypothetical protein